MSRIQTMDNDKISFTSAEYEMMDGRASPVSAMEEGAFNSHLTAADTASSKNTELSRSLDERHVNMIAFSTTVGIGCFLQSGKLISIIGPGGAVLAYILMGCLVWSANAGLSEMTAVFPVKGPIIDFCGRFIDESVGFAIGWMAWFAYCILLAVEVSVLSQTFDFKFPTEYLEANSYPEIPLQWKFGNETNPEIWIGLSLILILLINLLPVRVYGEIEYVFGSIKLIMMVLMIMFNIVISGINASNNPDWSRFWTYRAPYSFFTDNYKVTTPAGTTHEFFGDSGRLLAIWTAMNTIFFSVQGMFAVSVTAAENRRLETDETIKIASRKIALRVIVLYTLLVFSVGLNVPSDDPMLIDSSISSIRRGNHSPFIVSCIRSGVTGLPHLLNGFYIFSAFSCGINGLYTASRLLHALASIRNVWPGWAYWLKVRLERTTTKGVPVAAIFVSWFFGFLGFLGGRPEPAKILGRLAVLSSASMMVVYAAVSVAFVWFKSCTVEAEPMDPVLMDSDMGPVLNRSAATYPYRSHLQWARAGFAVIGCLLFLVFNGWKSLLMPFSTADFLASYTSIPVFIILVCAYHIKDERTWNPFRWNRRATMNIQNPMETTEMDPLKRRGRLHRANPKTFWCWENMKTFLDFIWVWLK